MTTADVSLTAEDSEGKPGRPVPASVQPVIPGFHPDPSICRVGDDYYLANSSFEYSPGVPIWHSTDLVRWRLIGNVLDRPDQFAPGHAASSKGVYAPTLRHHDGRFWLITTDVSGGGGQLLVSADDPSGPWSTPTIVAGLQGIDPDIVWTRDGACYVTYCSTQPGLEGIAQARIDPATGATLEPPRSLWSGTGLAFPEAPHLYERDGWWYLVIAEGGTERGHSVCVARGESPEGPFVPAPHNPIFSHRSTSHPVQNTGHADLVELPDGAWAMVYLGVRPRGVTPMFHVNGRETFLAGVRWSDGWPVIDATTFVAEVGDHTFSDDFAGDARHPRWISPGSALADFTEPAAAGGVVVRPDVAPSGVTSMMGVRVRDQRWRFESTVDVTDGAGAVRLRLDELHWCEVRADGNRLEAWMRIGPLEARCGDAPLPRSVVTLAIEAVPASQSGPDDIRLAAVVEGREHELARVDGRYLSTEVAGGFTGRVVGVRAVAGAPRLVGVRYDGFDGTAQITG